MKLEFLKSLNVPTAGVTGYYGAHYNNYLYLTRQTAGFEVYRVLNGNLTLITTLDPALSTCYGILGVGPYIFVAEGGNGLAAYILQNERLVLLDRIDNGGLAFQVQYKDPYFYLANQGDGLRAYTFNGQTFTNVGHQANPGGGACRACWPQGNYIYTCHAGDGIYAWTFNGAAFVAAGNIDDGGEARDVVADDQYIYLVNYTDGLRIYTHDGVTFTNVGHRDVGTERLENISIDPPYVYCGGFDTGVTNAILRIITFDGTVVNDFFIKNWSDRTTMYKVANNNQYLFITMDAYTDIYRAVPNFGGDVSVNISKGNTPLTVQFTDNTTIS